MRDRNLIGPWIRRFLLEHAVADRNLTRNTQASYRDMLLLLLPFASHARKTPIDRLMINDLSPALLRSFLGHLEKERGCSGATRNLRLAAVHSLAKFIGMRSPEHLAWSTEIRAVPFKKTQKSTLIYLDKPEVDALLEAPDQRTRQGRRDYALLLFLYNTGARAGEAAHLMIGDITWGGSPEVRLVGKGNKMRVCPIWRHTADELRLLAAARPAREFVFLNRRNEPLTRFGIYGLVRRLCGRRPSQDGGGRASIYAELSDRLRRLDGDRPGDQSQRATRADVHAPVQAAIRRPGNCAQQQGGSALFGGFDRRRTLG